MRQRLTYRLWQSASLRTVLLLVALHCSLFNFQFSIFNFQSSQSHAQTLTIGGNVYGGGNRGNLGGTTNVTINSGTFEGNLFGGARMAGVHTDGNTLGVGQYAANVTFKGGVVSENNAVYGGNDITGNVNGGTKVDIQATVGGSVYGGGNGSYAYTDNAALKEAAETSANAEDKVYADVYYSPIAILGLPGPSFTSLQSAQALNKFRPNVDKTLIRITGTSNEKRTVIGGKVFCGGNSATLVSLSGEGNPDAILQIGSYVTADEVFMGSNGENMVSTAEGSSLRKFNDAAFALGGKTYDYSKMDLTDASENAAGTFAEYMKGVEVGIRPTLQLLDGDAETTYIGSFFLGGNRGSVSAAGTFDLPFSKKIIIYDKLVGGCNNANVAATAYNAAYTGGLTNGADLTNGVKVELKLDNVVFSSRQLINNAGTFELKWKGLPEDAEEAAITQLTAGNIYGGCYDSGYINGSVKIDLQKDAIATNARNLLNNNSKAIWNTMRDDVFATGFSLFGGGKGVNTEIRGNVQINITGEGSFLKVFGGSQEGYIGQNGETATAEIGNTAITMTGGSIGKIYGGGFQGPITGHTTLNLNGGNAYRVIGGACNADIGGYAETYIGTTGIPTIEDAVLGGNDYGGSINGTKDFAARIREGLLSKVHGYTSITDSETDVTISTSPVLTASSYVEYVQGRVGTLFGGNYGAYTYPADFTNMPYFDNAFVNFKPNTNSTNSVGTVFGGSKGYEGYATDKKDMMQESSYVLVDIPAVNNFSSTDIFGAGDNCGIGMKKTKDQADALTNKDEISAIVDMMSGQVRNVYGASHNEGITRRTVVNVPAGSTAHMANIFGGGYGKALTLPCDVIEAHVNYSSNDASVGGYQTGIFGGNNNARRTLYAFVDINSPVWYDKASGYLATAYGAGWGKDTWAEYTQVNMNNGAQLYEVYGGGKEGKVMNTASVAAWKASLAEGALYTDLESEYTDLGLDDALVEANGLGEKTNTNVNIYTGANLSGYMFDGALSGAYGYGGGLGENAVVCGTTYIGLHGGTVAKDLYAGGTYGGVMDLYKVNNGFTASANIFIEGGTLRNAYGGGWRGSVGYHDPNVVASTGATTTDILGESNVVVGKLNGDSFINGIPAIKRNVYGGGEGGAIFGTANVTINKGYIGFNYDGANYNEELDELRAGDKRLDKSGNVFGGGYVANSYTDITNVNMYGGIVRGGLYGGGEIGPVGRGSMLSGSKVVGKYGQTHVTLWDGHVMRDVFGGGRGYDNWNGDGYMTEEEKKTMDLSAKGYVFGKTEVNIRGGEVGTVAGVADGFGNVFGGGNIGFVYSNGTKNTTVGPTYGYYLNGSEITEDCKVVVEPWCQVKTGKSVTINGNTYGEGEYVPTSALNYLGKHNTDATWNDLDDKGINIRNAVFAGGNVNVGATDFANTETVLGNVTATINDVYHRDLITIGTEHTGGLYGDGNLTFVDGYRELNITNYGTDYYGFDTTIDLDKYNQLTEREKAYFELKYRCKATYTSGNGTIYLIDKGISVEDYQALIAAYPDEASHWELAHFCSLYAGRLMNTIQRADFVGVFGSRMVLQGARDRVTDVADYTNYTINRVGEVSLNQTSSVIAGEPEGDAKHGNYFGIYSIVNYMGALTSDVPIDNVRTTDNTDAGYKDACEINNVSYPYGTATYAQWKEAHFKDRKRNNGTSPNKVALASGVYLELVKGLTPEGEKDYGPITGVVQLDLINVMPGLGGGYVYAKNEHGTRGLSGNDHTLLSSYNKESAAENRTKAVTNKIYTYDESALKVYETSGNFIHNTKQIVDDCYPTGGRYEGEGASPGHYWFIRGEIYVYDQYISAYTGSSTAYQESINIPLTITPASHGKLTIKNIQPNKYAYYSKNDHEGSAVIGEDGEEYLLVYNNTLAFRLNEPISYWDWYKLAPAERSLFVDKTYVSVADYKMTQDAAETISAGQVLLPAAKDALKASATHTDSEGNKLLWDTAKEEYVPFDDIIHISNNVSHETGYALAYDISNPGVWDKYYSPETGTSDETTQLSTKDYNNQSGYVHGPTYTSTEGGVFGQRDYAEGDIISQIVETKYAAVKANLSAEARALQATVKPAYVATKDVNYSLNGSAKFATKGAAISEDDYNVLSETSKASFAPANVCISTVELDRNHYVLNGELKTQAEIDALAEQYPAAATALGNSMVNAYYCTSSGLYGGNYFEPGHNYDALDAFSALTKTDRDKFTFNKDVLDILYDKDYKDQMNEYGARYARSEGIDYKAIYTGDPFNYTDKAGTNHTVNHSQELDSKVYENLPNEQRNYSSFAVENPGTYYIVKSSFMKGETSYVVGAVVGEAVYNSEPTKVDRVTITDAMITANTDTETSKVKPFYFCRNSYRINEKGEGQRVTDIIDNNNVYNNDDIVPVGTIINADNYSNLKNYQKSFTVHGSTPVETSTLYVSRESNIFDLQEDKIITVVYEYTYEESDESGNNIEQITEHHVVNVHVKFKSGVPTLTEMHKPETILPGSTVGLEQPRVTPGAYEVVGGGFEMFANQTDAQQHKNGIPYTNNVTPLYWYQNGYYVAYYAKTYLGKTYSNAVQFSVANYHDLDDVMEDKEHHMYVDNPAVKRNSKIYINNRNCTSDASKNELDLLRDFFDLSTKTGLPDEFGDMPLVEGSSDVHKLNDHVKNSQNLEFILRSDMSPKAYTTWTPIANEEGQCFEGVLHGDGHTITGLSHSLFGSVCGDIYNLGVTGSFSTAGLAQKGTGYAENCWVMSSDESTDMTSTYPIIGNPTRTEGTQIVNCYYLDANKYNTANCARGNAIPKPAKAFYNGEVAYNLNGFYLNKRYNDNATGLTQSYTYQYYDSKDLDNKDKMKLKQGKYVEAVNNYNYVEDRYSDGDFIYAAGTIPEVEDIRYDTDEKKYYPIWPDDYLFFGQTLTYGYKDEQAHQNTPSVINKSNNRLATTGSNRVYRAPAYYRSSNMDVAHFNIDAVFAAKSKDGLHEANINMTAIDFTGYNDGGYKSGQSEKGFFTPLLDYEGLSSIQIEGLTQNLLVYTPASTENASDVATMTNTVLNEYFNDPVYNDRYSNDKYRKVATVPAEVMATVKGHLVQKNGTYVAQTDHLLVDKQDFWCPIPYTFKSGKRMWYQRTPDNYADMDKGWEAVSLPFSAELVTTQDKGEITHFYQGSTVGHEYWLREYRSIDAKLSTESTKTATFAYPNASDEDKVYTNTFLWDYYYSKAFSQDANTDIYQQGYYNQDRTYEGYPYSEVGKPYLIGFPGKTYYEFDLSREWQPQHTSSSANISPVAKQTITFASEDGVEIGNSQDELSVGDAADGYTFKPNYLNTEVAAGAGYVLNSDAETNAGSSFDVATAVTNVAAFRPYFIQTPAPARTQTRGNTVEHIVFGSAPENYGIDDLNKFSGGLHVTTGHGTITVKSGLRETVTISIVNTMGITYATFTLEPGKSVTTHVFTGIYIVAGKKYVVK